ncbi:HAMP domain-containing sensor histidine kinase [Corynebacterium bovis]|uniref:HAMP domain-containing sensor histidine kinase n=1 Tax=Corynebacterium bovis TaxID=36808 RepID=UPI0021AB5AAC|nr:HAMP domain-containing sensor histidine kinase [Corynebacterium bovis]
MTEGSAGTPPPGDGDRGTARRAGDVGGGEGAAGVAGTAGRVDETRDNGGRPLTLPGVETPRSNPARARLSLRGRLTALTAAVVIVAIAVVSLSAYATVRYVSDQEISRNLQWQAQAIFDSPTPPGLSGAGAPSGPDWDSGTHPGHRPDEGQSAGPADPAPHFVQVTPSVRALVVTRRWSGHQAGVTWTADGLGGAEYAVLRGDETYSYRTANRQRILATMDGTGRAVVLTQDISSTRQMLGALVFVLVLVGIAGSLTAVIAGMAVATAGLGPVARLRRAVDRVSKTDELRPVPVQGVDEFAHLTESFNEMLRALQASRDKQAELVADASHELKTPLTSLRTNIELLMLASRPDTPDVSDADRREIERDVVAQIDEMASLVGDLVDLARADAMDPVYEDVDVVGTLREALDRVSRRRPDVTFESHLTTWHLCGDSFGLGRAFLNLLDNAAKWSPAGGVVRVYMDRIDDRSVEIRVADSGPGIPAEDRTKVFDRFYRSISSRSMPGSGLGLAIVKQVVETHGGVVMADESDDGGALIRLVLPGATTAHGSCPATGG